MGTMVMMVMVVVSMVMVAMVMVVIMVDYSTQVPTCTIATATNDLCEREEGGGVKGGRRRSVSGEGRERWKRR